jgi:hypothetical protein
MLQVPSVTMKGGSRNAVTRMPFSAPQARPASSPSGKDSSTMTNGSIDMPVAVCSHWVITGA